MQRICEAGWSRFAAMMRIVGFEEEIAGHSTALKTCQDNGEVREMRRLRQRSVGWRATALGPGTAAAGGRTPATGVGAAAV